MVIGSFDTCIFEAPRRARPATRRAHGQRWCDGRTGTEDREWAPPRGEPHARGRAPATIKRPQRPDATPVRPGRLATPPRGGTAPET